MPSWLFSLYVLALVTGPISSFQQNDFQATLGHLKPKTSSDVQTRAVQQLIVRTLGKDAARFDVGVFSDLRTADDKDLFQLKKIGSENVQIVGSSGVAVALGLHYYLKKYCGCHIAWEGSQLKLPNILPDVDEKVVTNDRFRYYQNVCTAGYSSAWWKWPEWERNIDWMALNGINLALAFHGQEAIWQRVYTKFQLSKSEIDQHFSGPAFLPWARMGNMRGWGGPLSNAWHNHTIQLQHMILKRMRELGIIPVLPAFAGHVPRDFIRVFPNASAKLASCWNHFEDAYCCPYALEPTDPLFQTVGGEFLKTYIEEFGTDHIYNCDSFNELRPNSGDLEYLRNVGKATFKAMQSIDSKAIWLLQGWLFVNDAFWTDERAEAYITSVPTGKMIILDLQSEKAPQYKRFKSYYGQPFIWCMLHNFGGTLGMFGSSEIINKRVFEARSMENSTMIGTGLTPEGINQNYVIYELMNEMGYLKKPVDLDAWFSNYATRRYGVDNELLKTAWKELGRSIYNYSDSRNIRGHYVITKRPSLEIEPWYWYDLRSFFKIWTNFVDASNTTADSELFKHDLVDISRQALQTTADFVYANICAIYKQQNTTLLKQASAQLLELFDDLEEILASSPDFLLGRWLESAKAVGTTAEERANYEFNARNQITLWGPNGEIVDYANKQWAGVAKDYFAPRWRRYLAELVRALETHEKFNHERVRRIIFNEIEKAFSYDTKVYPTKPVGDSIKIAAKIYKNWSKLWSV